MNKKLKTLKLFNETAEELQSSLFADFLNHHKKIFARYDIKTSKTILNLPDIHSIREFVLILRQFIQVNDPVSFKKMNDLYEKVPISINLKNQFREIFKKYNESLDSISFEFNNKFITYKEVLHAYTYGIHAHKFSSYRRKLNEWKKNDFIYNRSLFHYCAILVILLHLIRKIMEINKKTIEELSSRK